VKLVRPTISDIPKMQELVRSQVQDGVILYRDDDEVASQIRSYIVAKDGDEIAGFAALFIYTGALAEVRSLIVGEKYRRHGLGSKIVKKLEDEAKELGLKELLALTYQKSFFEKLGFTEIEKAEIPEHKIWADCIKCKHFPICNEISMIKTI
jgi:amino-acid N-acetyltransferase